MKSYEQLEKKIENGTFTKEDAKAVYPFVNLAGPDPLRARGITPESGENRRESGSRILRLLRRLLMGEKSE
jgi:hypothetical protein